MTDAARRVDRLLAVAPAIADPAVVPGDPEPTRPLTFEGVGHGRLFTGIDLTLARGEAVALVGPSGSGKSTLLAIAGGLIAPAQGRVRLAGHPLADWPEAELRHLLGMLPQRSALISGGIREALALGAPDLLDGEAWAVLEAVALRPVVERIGGLDGRLGEAGTGLSGGERRRLALARVLARRPLVLLLDEPTEGLDRATADRVLAGVRQLLPQAAILVAAHRPAEREWADRSFDLTRQAVLPGPSDGSQ